MNIISDEQVASLLTPSLSIESQRHAFLSPQITPPRNIISGDMVSGPTLFKPSAVSLPTRTHVGIKIVAVRPNNAALDPPLSTVPATILMLDDVTGVATHIIAATALTAIRTAGGSTLATQHLLPSTFTPKTVTVFAAGNQSYHHLTHLLYAYPTISHINVVNRSAPRMTMMLQDLRAATSPADFTSTEILLASAAGIITAVATSDIIVLATNSSTPLFTGADLPADKTIHIIGVGSYTPSMVEIDATTLAKCATVVVDTHGALTVGDLAQSETTKNDVVTLEELLREEKKERPPNQITFFKSVGVASQDIAAAGYVIDQLEKQPSP